MITWFWELGLTERLQDRVALHFSIVLKEEHQSQKRIHHVVTELLPFTDYRKDGIQTFI